MMTPLPVQDAVQRENRNHLLKALQKLGIRHVSVRYAASCSRQAICRIQVQPEHRLFRLAATSVVVCRETSQTESPDTRQTHAHIMPLDKALCSFALRWASSRHGRWTHDEGGSGEMTMDVESRHCHLRHEVYSMEYFIYSLKD